MESMAINIRLPDVNFWKNRSVLITGHSGFKGGWLSLWLSHLGAKVYGYALSPPTNPNFFSCAQIKTRLAASAEGNILEKHNLCQFIEEAAPSVIIHMAAQSLVRRSYRLPVNTLETNILGTVNLFEASRISKTVKAILNVTSDKCYENLEVARRYTEDDKLGGSDPYSVSKACSELITTAYQKSFFDSLEINVATARAGNVFGGGDWAVDRLVPDFFRSLSERKPLLIRCPDSVRPWQHVLEPLAGYIFLVEDLVIKGKKYLGSWNFGPNELDTRSVDWVIRRLSEYFPEVKVQYSRESKSQEATMLALDSSKSIEHLNWAPRWGLELSLSKTAEWFLAWKKGESMEEFSLQQILSYHNL